ECLGSASGPFCAAMEAPRLPSRDLVDCGDDCVANRPGSRGGLADPFSCPGRPAALRDGLPAVEQQCCLVGPYPSQPSGADLLSGSAADRALMRRAGVLLDVNNGSTNGAQGTMRR